MKNLLKYSLLALALALSTNAFAQNGGWGNGGGNGGWNPPPGQPPPNNNVAPEVDPSLALSGITLLGGALTVLRSRRRK